MSGTSSSVLCRRAWKTGGSRVNPERKRRSDSNDTLMAKTSTSQSLDGVVLIALLICPPKTTSPFSHTHRAASKPVSHWAHRMRAKAGAGKVRGQNARPGFHATTGTMSSHPGEGRHRSRWWAGMSSRRRTFHPNYGRPSSPRSPYHNTTFFAAGGLISIYLSVILPHTAARQELRMRRNRSGAPHQSRQSAHHVHPSFQ